MARKRGGRRAFKRYLKGKVNFTIALGTLAADTVLGANVVDVLTEKAWLSSVKARWSMENWTDATNVGPILVGVAHSDYSDTEIEEWIENAASWKQGDKVSQEIARRKIREVGMFQTPRTAAATAIAVLNQGSPITTKCNWQLITGQTLKIWTFNTGGAAVATTDPAISVNGHCNLWPN